MDARYYDPFNIRTAEEWKQGLTKLFKENDFIYQGAIEKNGSYIGHFRYFTSPDGLINTFLIFVREEELDEEIMEEVWTSITWWMRKKGHTQMVWRSRQNFWLPIKEKLGGKKTNTGCCFRLFLRDIDRNQMDLWIAEGESKTRGFYIVEQEYLEERFIEEMAQLADQLVMDMPREDRTLDYRSSAEYIRVSHERNKADGFKQHQLILFSPDHKMAGTTLILLKHPDMEIDQRITGTAREFRRQGLAKYLKALMMKRVLEWYPQAPSIRTECFRLNVPMINLNLEMGYKLVAEDVDHVFTFSDWEDQ